MLHSANHTPLSVGVRLGVYASFGVGEAIAFGIALLALLLGSQSASRNLHSPMLGRILHAPMSFFDTTPLGRIMNRFGKDIDVVDSVLAINFRYFLMCFTQVCGTLFVITFTTPSMFLFPHSSMPLSTLNYSSIHLCDHPTGRTLHVRSQILRTHFQATKGNAPSRILA